MAKKQKERMNSIKVLIRETEKQLSYYKVNYQGLDWRNKVLLLVSISNNTKELGKYSYLKAAKLAARDRLRLYLTKYVGIVLSSEELAVVSGISEFARRIRELRVQEGYKILTGYSNDPELGIQLGPSDYLLLDKKPDITAARRWHFANRIRNEKKGGSKKRILNYLLENVGQVVTSEELYYVANAKEFGRRTRELRTEEGYPIATKLTGRPDLRMGEYVLESKERIAEPHDRKVPFEVQKEVYSRAGNSCEICGWNHDKWRKGDPRILELHHLEEHAKGGKNTARNLIVTCSRCHDKMHSKKMKVPKKLISKL